MKTNTKEVRKQIKALLINSKENGVHIGEGIAKLQEEGFSSIELQNALSFFRHSPSQAKFRMAYGIN